MAGQRWIIGIDEVGRGALAGPVVVAVAAVPQGMRFAASAGRGTLKDSKKLSPKRREAWSAHVNAHPRVVLAVARVYPRQIERRNISGAANTAALRAFLRLIKKHRKIGLKTQIFLDGGLFLGSKKHPGKTMVKGDEKINAIKIASIVAKVHRDAFMVHLAKKYPRYGFEIHKGYGTALHRRALRKYGPSPVHRLTFLRKSHSIEK